jgi:hypothetical protein
VAVTVVGLIWMNLAFAPRREPHWQPEIPGPGGSRRASGVASDPTRPVDLEGGSLSRDGRLSIPTRVRVSGDVLVVLDRYAERQVIFLHADTGEPLGSAGPRGEGPGELLGAWSVKPDPADPTRIWVLDVGNGRLTRFETGAPGVRHVAALSAGPGDGNPPTVRLETPAPLTDVLPRPDGTFLGLGFFDEGRFGVFGPDGRWRGAIGPVPDEDSGLPPAVLAHAWQGMLRARPDGRRLVVACRHAAMLQLYAPDGRLLAEADGPDPFRPRFTVVRGARGPVFASGEDLRFGYVDVAVTGDRIYALYSGRTRADAGPDAVFGREVHEFDWDGRFLGGHLLDADVISIEVDPEGRRLWAVRHDPVPEVREYRLDR